MRVTTIQPGDCATDLVMENTDKEACAAMGVTPGEKVGAGWANEWQLLQPKDVADAVVRSCFLMPACKPVLVAHASLSLHMHLRVWCCANATSTLVLAFVEGADGCCVSVGGQLYAATAPPHVAVNEILVEPRDQA